MGRWHHATMAALSLLASFGLSGCSDYDTPVASVTLTPQADTVRVGMTTQLTATLQDDAGNPLSGRIVSYSSSDVTVALVDGSGLVIGVGHGTANITATSEGVTSSPTVISSWRGITGSWSGQLVIQNQFFCPLTQSVMEDAAGRIAGSGTIGPPCPDNSYTLSGTNNTGGVADSTEVSWERTSFATLFSGTFDGADTMTGEANDGVGCLPGSCVYILTRDAFAPVVEVGS